MYRINNRLVIVLISTGLVLGSVGFAYAEKANNDEAKEFLHFSQAKISLADAIKAAENKVGGKAMEAELDDEPKTVQFEVEVVKDGKIHKVSVDGKTGLVLAAALDDDKDDEHVETEKE